MANTLALVDSRAQVTVYFLNLHEVKSKVGNKLTKQFNLEIALFDPSQSGEVENPYAKATLTQKMSSFFKNITTGKFFIKDNLPNKNLRLETTENTEEDKRKSREEHQIIVACIQNRVVLLHSNPYLGKIYIFELDSNQIYRYQ